MSQEWKTVNVFVSSNYADLTAEREHLVRAVFPALREELEKYCVHLVDIDPWCQAPGGQVDPTRFLAYCFRRMGQGHSIFLGLLGNRYGDPVNEIAPAVLQGYPWLKENLGKCLAELQFLHGALNRPVEETDAFFYCRADEALEGVPEDWKNGVFAETDDQRREQLDGLKAKLEQSGYPVCAAYPAEWSGEAYDRARASDGAFVSLDEFGQQVMSDVLEAVKRRFGLPESPPSGHPVENASAEQLDQAAFAGPRLNTFAARQGALRYLWSFIEDEDEMPCLVTGDPGMGKSSLLLELLAEYRKKYPEALVLAHFVGLNPSSRSLTNLLRKFCLMLKQRLGLTDDVPDETNELAALFKHWIGQVPEELKTLVVLDGLNHLDPDHQSHELLWLPEEFPYHVRVLTSFDANVDGSKDLQKVFYDRVYASLELSGPSQEEKAEVARKLVTPAPKVPTPQQVALLFENPATDNSLFLATALKELMLCRTEEEATQFVQSVPAGEKTPADLFTLVLQRFEDEFGHELVQTTLAPLAFCRHGLHERDLAAFVADVAGGEDLQLLLNRARPYLRTRGTAVAAEHSAFIEAIRNKFAHDLSLQTEWYKHLADYFESFGRTSREASANLPWLYLQSQDFDSLADLLCDLSFIEAKCTQGMAADLVADYDMALNAWPQYSISDPLNREGSGGEGSWGGASFDISAEEKEEHEVADASAVLEKLAGLKDEQRIVSPEKPAYGDEDIIPAKYFGEDEGQPDIIKKMYQAEKASQEEKDLFFKEDAPSKVHVFASFVTDYFEELRSQPASTVFLARNQGTGGPLDEKAEEFTESLLRPWIARDPRPSARPLRPLCVQKLEGHTSAVTTVALNASGSRVISGSDDDTLRVWDIRSGVTLYTPEEHLAEITAVASAPEADRIVSASKDGTVRVWNLNSEESVHTLEGHSGAVTAVAVSSDGSLAASAGEDAALRIWNLESGELKHEIQVEPLPAEEKAGKKDKAKAKGSEGEKDSAESEEEEEKKGEATEEEAKDSDGDESPETEEEEVEEEESEPTPALTSVAMTPDGKLVLAAGPERGVQIWNVESGEKLLALRVQNGPVRSMALTPDAKLALLACEGGQVQVWDPPGRKLLLEYEAHTQPIRSIDVGPDGRAAVTASADNSIGIWDVASGNSIRKLSGHSDEANAAVITPDYKLVVSASADGDLLVWDIASGQSFPSLHDAWVAAVVGIAPDESTAISATPDHRLRFWDSSTGQTLRSLVGHSDDIRAVIYTPDGKIAVSASKDQTVVIWDLVTGEKLHTLEAHLESVNALALTPDGRLAVSGSSDGGLRIWDIRSGEQVRAIEGHRGAIRDVIISPNGRKIIDAGDDNTLRIYDLATGETLNTLEGHSFPVRGVGITPDGQYVVSGSWDKTVRAWNANSGEMLATYLARSFMDKIAEIKPDGAFGAGTSDGHMHFLNLRNFALEDPIVTAIRGFHFEFKTFGKRVTRFFQRVFPKQGKTVSSRPSFEEGQKMGGNYDDTPTMRCPWCGLRSPVPEEPLMAITSLMDGLEPDRPPCLSLPEESFQGPELQITCEDEECGKTFRLNPFAVDNKD